MARQAKIEMDKRTIEVLKASRTCPLWLPVSKRCINTVRSELKPLDENANIFQIDEKGFYASYNIVNI